MRSRRRLCGATLAFAAARMAGGGPVSAAGTGQIFVSNERSNEIFVLGGSSAVVTSFKSCGRPRGMKFMPDHTRLAPVGVIPYAIVIDG